LVLVLAANTVAVVVLEVLVALPATDMQVGKAATELFASSGPERHEIFLILM
jgi:hypothetical protein